MFKSSVAEYRLKIDWGFNEFAKFVGISPATLWRIENGESNPSLDTAIRISEAFGVPVEQLFTRNIAHS